MYEVSVQQAKTTGRIVASRTFIALEFFVIRDATSEQRGCRDIPWGKRWHTGLANVSGSLFIFILGKRRFDEHRSITYWSPSVIVNNEYFLNHTWRLNRRSVRRPCLGTQHIPYQGQRRWVYLGMRYLNICGKALRLEETFCWSTWDVTTMRCSAQRLATTSHSLTNSGRYDCWIYQSACAKLISNNPNALQLG